MSITVNIEVYPIEDCPRISGRYFVFHRGYGKVLHWFGPDKEWIEGTRLGWRDAHEPHERYPLSFGPTHWYALPDPDKFPPIETPLGG
jgi:hypothetical protein